MSLAHGRTQGDIPTLLRLSEHFQEHPIRFRRDWRIVVRVA
jgi:hypothetical protein